MSGNIGPDIDAPGQDSFLDVVANLVGILVILVMVIGVRARDRLTQAHPLPELDKGTAQQIDQLTDETNAITVATQHTAQEINRLQRETLVRQLERDRLQVLLVAAQRNEQGQGDPQAQQQQELLRQLEQTRHALQQTQQTIDSLASQPQEPIVLHHQPTPLAKTVFGKEQHFRLKNGYVAYIPMDEMVEELKREAQRKVAQLNTVPQIIETLGPRSGFHIRYSLRRRQVVVETEAGRMAREIAELAWFELLPQREPLGEPVAQALTGTSQLAERIAQWEPNETIITLWTYPNDFPDFRRLKDHLQSKGFLVAGRPLPEGQPITGSPEGTRSAAQ